MTRIQSKIIGEGAPFATFKDLVHWILTQDPTFIQTTVDDDLCPSRPRKAKQSCVLGRIAKKPNAGVQLNDGEPDRTEIMSETNATENQNPSEIKYALEETVRSKPAGVTPRDNAALRRICADMNAGLPPEVQAEIRKQMKDTVDCSVHAIKATPQQAAALGLKPSEEEPSPPVTEEKPDLTGLQGDIPIDPMPVVSAPPRSAPTVTKPARPTTPPPSRPMPDQMAATPRVAKAPSRIVRPQVAQQEQAPAPQSESTSINTESVTKIVLTGRIKSGKDYCAIAAGAKVFGFADPIYGLLEYFFGLSVDQKDAPGAREFMQKVGCWGRADLDEQSIVSPERAVWTRMIQNMGSLEPCPLPFSDVIDWTAYGTDPEFWLKACLHRATSGHETADGKPVAITNARFENEIKQCDAAGWTRFHVMCSDRAWQQRVQKDSVPATALNHTSEVLAKKLDQSAMALARRTPKAKINVVWSDRMTPPPSSKFYTIDEFVARIHGRYAP